MKIGIDKIGFATSNYVLKLNDLGAARGTDPEKLSKASIRSRRYPMRSISPIGSSKHCASWVSIPIRSRIHTPLPRLRSGYFYYSWII